VCCLRVPVDRLGRLRRLAAEKDVAPSALMRSWVLERLDAEASAAASGLVSLATGALRSADGS
jgi:hypothetical protein